MGVLLAVLDNGLLPGPLSIHVLAVLGLGGVELGELVALIIGSDVKDGDVVVTADDESTLDDGVVVGAVDGGAAEEVLAGSLEAGVKATDEVVGHESQGKLIVVLVTALPDGVLVEGNVLPEPLEGLGGVNVGVLTLPLIKREGGLGKGLKGVLGFGGLSGLLGSRSSGLRGSLGDSGLGSLNLLGSDVGQLGGIKKSELGGNSRVDGLVVDSRVPTGDVGVLLLELLAEEVLEAAGDQASGEEIGEGDALTDKVSVVGEVSIDNGDDGESLLLSLVNSLLVVGGLAKERAEPVAELGEDLAVEEGHPLEDGSIAANMTC